MIAFLVTILKKTFVFFSSRQLSVGFASSGLKAATFLICNYGWDLTECFIISFQV
jgi:hypothetical protein